MQGPLYQAEETLEDVMCSLQIHGPECGVFGRSRSRGKCGSRQYQCGGDCRQRRERFPIARPPSRDFPTFHCDAGPNQEKFARSVEAALLARRLVADYFEGAHRARGSRQFYRDLCDFTRADARSKVNKGTEFPFRWSLTIGSKRRIKS